MNWLSKIDAFIITVRAQAVAHWDVAMMLALVLCILAYVIAARNPSKRREMRTKIRIFRYCHDCKFADLNTESCSIAADRLDRCGLIDRQAGMDFDVTKND